MSETSFVNNIAAGVTFLGVENAPIIYSMAKINWASAQDRDAVFAWLGADDGE